MTDKAKELAKTLRGIVANKIHVSRVFEDRRMAEAADLIESLAAELEQVKKERDEMFDILSDERNCADCKHLIRSYGEEPCRTCLENTNTKVNWQWRGVKE